MNKYLKYAAAAIFIATLAINIAITMDDPFVLLSDAMAETTTTTTSTTTTQMGPPKWKQKVCKNGVTIYEVCQYYGDGNVCSPVGSRTRQCPYPGD